MANDKDTIKKLQQGVRANIAKLLQIPGVVPDEDDADDAADFFQHLNHDTTAADADVDRRFQQALSAGFKGSREDYVTKVMGKES